MLSRKAELLGTCLAVETCNGRRVRTWARGGAGGAPARAAEDRAPGSQAPAYLGALQAFLPEGFPASVTPDYLRALPLCAFSCPLTFRELLQHIASCMLSQLHVISAARCPN